MPGLSGLCGYSFKCSRQWVHKFRAEHPDHETTKFLDTVTELFADCLTNAALSGASNTVMSLFVLKNCHGYVDKVELEAVSTIANDDDNYSADDIAKRYLAEGAEADDTL
jgi:hypothetical protein